MDDHVRRIVVAPLRSNTPTHPATFRPNMSSQDQHHCFEMQANENVSLSRCQNDQMDRPMYRVQIAMENGSISEIWIRLTLKSVTLLEAISPIPHK